MSTQLTDADSAALFGRINALLALRRPAEALDACDVLNLAQADYPGLKGLRACALLALKRFTEALEAAEAAASSEPGDAQGFVALGFSALAVGKAARGLAAFDRAIELQPRLARGHAGKAMALAAAGRHMEAIVAFRRAAELDPSDPNVLLQMGQAMLRMGRLDEAYAAFGAALERQPGLPAALEGRAMVLIARSRPADAVPVLAALRSVAPSMDYLAGQELHARLLSCDWREFDALHREISERVRRGERADPPLSFIVHSDSAADQRICAQTFVADKCRVDAPPVQRAARTDAQRLRVAYLSADFGDHPVAQLIAGLIESHDRSRFETYGISVGTDDGSELRRRLARGFEHFLDLEALSDAEIAACMAAQSIDIAVDLGGHTRGSRTRVLAYRPAPIQISFLGFPGTLGADFIDYIIADRHVIPERDCIDYTERVIYMPDSYMPQDFAGPRREPPPRASAGLPAGVFVYCCFHSPHKFSPALFEAWMRVLRAVPDSVLWLRATSTVAKQNLERAARTRGVDPARFVYAPKAPTLADYRARLSLADLFLDTHPYNAHTTASDALCAGVPLLTLKGRTFSSRVASSLLHACGLGDLSVETLQAYEGLAIELGRTPSLATELKRRLCAAAATGPLFDTPRYRRHLEAAYCEIWSRHQRGEVPANVWVERIT